MDDFQRIWPYVAPNGRVGWAAKRGGCFRGGSLRSPLALGRAAIQLCSQGFDFYLGLNPARARGCKAKRAEVLEFRQLLLDIDPVADEYDASLALDRALAIATDVLVASGGHGNVGESALVLDSGRGMQAWLQFEPIVLKDEQHRIEVELVCSGLLNGIAKVTGTFAGCRVDTKTSDLPRIARCPGSINSKTGRRATIQKVARGILRLPPGVPTINVQRHERTSPPLDWGELEGVQSARLLARIKPLARDFLCYGVLEPGRHAAGYHCASELARLGLPESAAVRWVSDGLALCRPPLPQTEATRIVRNAYRRFLELRPI